MTSDASAALPVTRALLGMRDLLLCGYLQCGERLNEAALAERLDVARVPLRAAVSLLVSEGMLVHVSATEFEVGQIGETAMAHAIDARGWLEGLAVRMAAERGVAYPVLQRLRSCLADIDRILAARTRRDDRRLEEYMFYNCRFHELLYDACGSVIVRRALRRVLAQPFSSPSAFVLAQASMPGVFDALQAAQRQHHQIVEAIGARAGAVAAGLAGDHARVAHSNLMLARHALIGSAPVPLIHA